MDGQRQSSSRRRKPKRSRAESKSNGKGQARTEPILIAARRPNAPAARPKRRFIAASAAPRPLKLEASPAGATHSASERTAIRASESTRNPVASAADDASSRHDDVPLEQDSSHRRAARIVQVQSAGPDDREKQRLKLIERLLHSEGRAAITRAAREIETAGFEFPVEQEVQLQLLEHFDESCVYRAICNLRLLLNEETPIKRPLFEQRLRRLEEFADDAETRSAAAELRRTVRA